MAKKGHLNKQKRISAHPIRNIARKEAVWTVKSMPGTHTANTSIPLGLVVRDMLTLSRTMRETKHLLSKGIIQIDHAVRKEYQFPVGLFDAVSIPSTKKNYRLSLDTKGRMTIHEMEGTIPAKPAKVMRKIIAKGKTIQVQTHDGNTYRGADTKIKVGDSVLIGNKSTIEGHLPLSNGSHVFITGGTHVGEVALVKGIVPGTMKRDALVDLTEGEAAFQTTTKNVMVIDDITSKWIKHTMSRGKGA
ncbi:MAG: 30S ribosomal protein S4e [archaeon]